MIIKIIAFFAAVLDTYILGAIFVSQGNIASVTAMGFEVSLFQRFEAMLHDVLNMTAIYLPLISIALLIAFPIAALIIKRAPHMRLTGYVLGGFVGMLAIHVIMKAVLGMSGVAPTREVVGLLAQGVAGGVGGLTFHLISRPKQAVTD